MPLIDQHLGVSQEELWRRELKHKNEVFKQEMQQKIEELSLFIKKDSLGYEAVSGRQPDCCSLLS